MIYTINEINQQTPKALPNITLGYDIYDTCGDVSYAIKETLHLLNGQLDPLSCFLPAKNYSASPESLTKISYASTSELLSRKLKFPTFLRTLSSDTSQTKGIAELAKQFNWKTVAIVGSDDEYGKYGCDRLMENFSTMKDVCIDFIDIMPGDFSQNNSETHTKLAELMEKIKKSPAEAIILFTKGANVNVIMEAAIRRNFNRTWIASDSWSTSSTVSAMSGIERIGQVFGFISKRNEVPGFKDYVIAMFNRTTNNFIRHYLRNYPPCTGNSTENNETDCSLTTEKCLDPRCLANHIDQDGSYNVYIAMKVIVESLRRLMRCDSNKCKRDTNFTALELLMEIKKINFTVDTTHIWFDANGDPSIGYDIVQWNMAETKQHIKTIGEYWPSGNIKLPHDLIAKMRNVTVTAFNCYKTCKPGYELKQQRRRCCKECVLCADGEFSFGNGMECERCKAAEYSSPQRDECLNKTVEFINWSDPFVIILTSFEILGIIITVLFAVLFTVHRNTPIVKAVGGYLCFLELLSLLACFCLTFTFTGKPTKASCMAGLPLFSIAFTICISCILANLLQILVGFSFDPKQGDWLKKLNQPVAVVAIIFGIQLALCVPWLTVYPPYPKYLHSMKTILLHCEKGSKALFGAILGYNALLALICFFFAFKGKRLPDLYKNASLITISMLLYLVIWILFIPIYIKMDAKYTRAIEAAAILISSYSILCCHLAPKCYIMLFRKEINNENAITEYIRKHYEQKGMAVVRS
ncbi:hypothetical protein LDENG_00025360 [Lucifuga dentata]|nr:hypothetical protein LDENG_00025360 [Lucifuga dentata]